MGRRAAGWRSEWGQGTVEWVGLVALVALLLVALAAAGVRVPGAALAQAIASRILCAAAQAEHCGDEPGLIAAYGAEVGELVRRHMPTLMFEEGSRALPVDFRNCRVPSCAYGTARGLVQRTDDGLPVTAFVHVVDCRPEAAAESVAAGADCSGPRSGNLYISYWTYYPESATLRGVPIVGAKGYHVDDWESVQIRIGPDGTVSERASSHHGYNSTKSVANWASDAGIGPVKDLTETVGIRDRDGWGSETGALFVSGGSHAGNTGGAEPGDRFTPGRQVHLVPLEEIARLEAGTQFAITPPWLKHVWRDPESNSTE